MNNGEIKEKSFNIISEYAQKPTPKEIIRGFRLLREQNFFRKIEKNYYIVWMNCDKNFNSPLVIGYLFRELKDQNIFGTFYFIKIK